MHSLFVECDELKAAANNIAQIEFTQIADMCLCSKNRMIGFLPVGWATSGPQHGLVATHVEQDMIIGEIQVTVIVYPLRLNVRFAGE